MSLNNIQLHPAILEDLFKNNLVEIISKQPAIKQLIETP